MDSLKEPHNEKTSPANWRDRTRVIEEGDRTYYLLGTAHVSRKSVEDVQNIIEEVQPDSVCVELCQARYDGLINRDGWKKLNISQVIREGKTLYLLSTLALGAFQRRIGEKLGVEPGSEMLQAIRSAEGCNASLELVDRDVQATLKRTWANLTFWDRIQMIGLLMSVFLPGGEEPTEEDIEALKDSDQLPEMLTEFARAMPQVKGPLIDERDSYLMAGVEAAPGKKIVAVVGAAHVEGMAQNFGKDTNRDRLSIIPEPSPLWKGVKWVLPILILAAFSFGWYRHQGDSLEDMLIAWVLPNSVFCGLMTALAGGRILSVITGFLASPITSLNPLLPAGVVVGLVEAWQRKPRVEDAENINRDVQSLRGVYKNRFTRVLLVVAMSTFGSAIGAWIGLGWLVSLLAN